MDHERVAAAAQAVVVEVAEVVGQRRQRIVRPAPAELGLRLALALRDELQVRARERTAAFAHDALDRAARRRDEFDRLLRAFGDRDLHPAQSRRSAAGLVPGLAALVVHAEGVQAGSERIEERLALRVALQRRLLDLPLVVGLGPARGRLVRDAHAAHGVAEAVADLDVHAAAVREAQHDARFALAGQELARRLAVEEALGVGAQRDGLAREGVEHGAAVVRAARELPVEVAPELLLVGLREVVGRVALLLEAAQHARVLDRRVVARVEHAHAHERRVLEPDLAEIAGRARAQLHVLVLVVLVAGRAHAHDHGLLRRLRLQVAALDAALREAPPRFVLLVATDAGPDAEILERRARAGVEHAEGEQRSGLEPERQPALARPGREHVHAGHAFGFAVGAVLPKREAVAPRALEAREAEVVRKRREGVGPASLPCGCAGSRSSESRASTRKPAGAGESGSGITRPQVSLPGSRRT